MCMRTYLAWVRTSVALLAAAAALVQLVPSFAAEIIAITNGLQLQWLLDPDGVDMTANFRRLH